MTCSSHMLRSLKSHIVHPLRRHRDLRCAASNSNTIDPALPDNATYAIVGSGALGGFYGAKLQQAGHKVHFLINTGHKHVQTHGFTVISAHGDFVLPEVNAYQRVEDMPPCDVVVVALKTTSNHILPHLLPPLMKPGSVVLCLQNGLGVEEQVAAIVGPDRVMGGGCFLCSNKLGPGMIHHVDYGDIVLGEYRRGYAPVAEPTQRMRKVAADLGGTGIKVQLEEDLFIARWKKLVWNIPYNGMSVLMSASTDQMMASPQLKEQLHQLMQETVAAAAASARHLAPGLPPREIPPSFPDFIMDFTAAMKPYKPSMLLDYMAGRPMEVDALYGAPLLYAQQAGCATPRIALLHSQLQFLDSRRRPTAAAAAPLSSAARGDSL